jgi:predicted metal-dependent hydrolase
MPTEQRSTDLVTFIGEEGEHRREHVSPQFRTVLRDTGAAGGRSHRAPVHQKGHHNDP